MKLTATHTGNNSHSGTIDPLSSIVDAIELSAAAPFHTSQTLQQSTLLSLYSDQIPPNAISLLAGDLNI